MLRFAARTLRRTVVASTGLSQPLGLALRPDGSLLAMPSPLQSDDASWGTIKLWRTTAPEDVPPVTLWLKLRGDDPMTGFVNLFLP